MTLHRDHAIVLRTYKLGEADRITVLLTEHLGKLRAVAKGVRKTTSRLGGRLEPPSHGAMQLYEGRGELWKITQVETVDHFRAIRDDLHRVTKAGALCEVADLLAPDHEPNDRRYSMLLGALRALAARDSALLVPGFYLRSLAAEGLAPQVEACAICNRTDDLVAFDVNEGGALCGACRSGRPLSAPALALLRKILGGELGAALNESPSAATHEVELLATAAMEHHVERRLKAQSLIERTS